ncbi:MAG: type III pantothenate kinase [Bacteroidota bacterium]
MNLIVDVGNTYIKLAVFNDNVLQAKVAMEHEQFETELEYFLAAQPAIDHAIVSSVGGMTETQLELLRSRVPVFELSHEAKLPFYNQYATPTTLGVDRIALVSAAAEQYPDTNVLVIDAGSCITYDFLTDQNTYLGGAIAPGIEMRYKAMNTFTANLPLLESTLPDNLVGDSTAKSMHVGVIQGVINEIDGFIEHYIEKFGNLTVILTGGDTHFLRDSIKNDIFANSNFLLEGLNYILEINKD